MTTKKNNTTDHQRIAKLEEALHDHRFNDSRHLTLGYRLLFAVALTASLLSVFIIFTLIAPFQARTNQLDSFKGAECVNWTGDGAPTWPVDDVNFTFTYAGTNFYECHAQAYALYVDCYSQRPHFYDGYWSCSRGIEDAWAQCYKLKNVCTLYRNSHGLTAEPDLARQLGLEVGRG